MSRRGLKKPLVPLCVRITEGMESELLALTRERVKRTRSMYETTPSDLAREALEIGIAELKRRAEAGAAKAAEGER